MLPLRDRLPTQRTPVVNYLLILANVLAFVWERTVIAAGVHPQRLLLEWGLVPELLVQSPLEHGVTVLTSMFLHSPTDWLHIAGNMLFLWIFGDNVEDAMGSAKYAAFYVLCGLGAALAQVFIDPGSGIPMVGASGAISGVLAAYATLYPRSPILVLNPVLPLWFFFGITLELPAFVVIALYFVVNLLNAVGTIGAVGGGVAFFAHVGGFVAGLAMVRLFVTRPPRREYRRWDGWHASRQPPRPVWVERRPPRRRPDPRDPWRW
jgi:membrane associated rhomboid family serine protease